jgi:hypothetical protein
MDMDNALGGDATKTLRLIIGGAYTYLTDSRQTRLWKTNRARFWHISLLGSPKGRREF